VRKRGESGAGQALSRRKEVAVRTALGRYAPPIIAASDFRDAAAGIPREGRWPGVRALQPDL